MPDDFDPETEFNISSIYPLPPGYNGPPFKIRNDYPDQSDEDVSKFPWLVASMDFRVKPKEYLEALLEYCFEGMPECDFVVQNNTQVRNWYHAPWMHYHAGGREPIHGLTFERPTPPYELALSQTSWLQTWACAYYNSVGATVFAKVWADRANPDWENDVSFPEGSVVFKILMTDASNKELPFMKNSPTWEAVTAQQPNEDGAPIPGHRNTVLSKVRLLQVDVAARDNRAETAWTFGTFVYDGRGTPEVPVHLRFPKPLPTPAQWRSLIPIGLMWGNDPELNQEAVMRGGRPQEHWINPAADVLFQQLNPNRYWWGWNGRMNGPADDFISACSSCHSVAQRILCIKDDEFKLLVPPPPEVDAKQQLYPKDDEETMRWFRNLKDMRFNPEAPSGDYSLQLMMGYNNFQRRKAGVEPSNFSLRFGHAIGM